MYLAIVCVSGFVLWTFGVEPNFLRCIDYHGKEAFKSSKGTTVYGWDCLGWYWSHSAKKRANRIAPNPVVTNVIAKDTEEDLVKPFDGGVDTPRQPRVTMKHGQVRAHLQRPLYPLLFLPLHPSPLPSTPFR